MLSRLTMVGHAALEGSINYALTERQRLPAVAALQRPRHEIPPRASDPAASPAKLCCRYAADHSQFLLVVSGFESPASALSSAGAYPHRRKDPPDCPAERVVGAPKDEFVHGAEDVLRRSWFVDRSSITTGALHSPRREPTLGRLRGKRPITAPAPTATMESNMQGYR
jgi:hypothetical protein